MPTISNYASDGTLIARAVSAFAQQAYTEARLLSGTGLIGSDARISVNDEDYFGTIRWDQTLGDNSYTQAAVTGAVNVNYGNESQTEGLTTDFSTDFSRYIKSNRNVGMRDYNITQVISRHPGSIQTVGSQMGRIRARDEDDALQAVLQGVIREEVSISTAVSSGSAQFGQILSGGLDDAAGFYFDVNGPNASGVTQTDNAASRSNTLIDTSNTGGGRAASRIFEAMGAAFADLEPESMYLIVDPETYYDIRLANLLDAQQSVSDGNIDVPTMLNGKIRVYVTRKTIVDAATGLSGNGRAVNAGSTRTSLLCLPGQVAMVDLPMVNPVEFDRDASVGRGTGETEAWYRWGYVMHPRGYDWEGSYTAFATNATYSAAASWNRKEDVGNLGILPIFHA